MILFLGGLFGAFCGYLFYKKSIVKIKEIELKIENLNNMEANTEDRIWLKIEQIIDDITELKIEVAKIKVKVGFYAGIFSMAGVIIASIVKEVLIK